MYGKYAGIGGLTKKAEPPPTNDVNRDSGTDSANGGWLRRLVRRHVVQSFFGLYKVHAKVFVPSAPIHHRIALPNELESSSGNGRKLCKKISCAKVQGNHHADLRNLAVQQLPCFRIPGK